MMLSQSRLLSTATANKTKISGKTKAYLDEIFTRSPAQFVGSAHILSNGQIAYPDSLKTNQHKPLLPEIGFLGESNAGKSSLINALLSSDIVKTSRKIGHTKAVNFFNVDDRFVLVDMPGYGKGSQTQWGDLALKYIENRRNLRRLFILRDCRYQLKQSDRDMIAILEEFGVPYQIILTKSDMLPEELKSFRERICGNVEEYVRKSTTACIPTVLMTSSNSGDGIYMLRLAMLEALGIRKEV